MNYKIVIRKEVIILIFLFLILSIKLRGQEPPDRMVGDLSPKAVRDGISGGIDYLRSVQKADGSWNEYPGYDPGSTALCALALITAGMDKTDPILIKALEFLRRPLTASQWQTYPVSLQTMVFCLASPVKDRDLIERNVKWIISRQFQEKGIFQGGWSYYGVDPTYNRADNSNSQFAVLALYEAERIGVKIDQKIWDLALDYWSRMQNKDGSWGYRATINPSLQTTNSGDGTGSMTCAGIAALVICSGIRESGGARIDGEKLQCCQEVDDTVSERINNGLAWMAKHFSIQTNPGTNTDIDTWLYYYLYGLERVGRLTAHRFIGNNDWYREGTDFLLRRKGALSKIWKAQSDLKGNNAISTAFALLFLSKGRRPCLVSKYKYGAGTLWNAHPNDLQHLTNYVEKQWKMELIWQVIEADKATMDDLLQTPVLYFCGTESPIPKDETAKRKMVLALRGYLEQGGFILAEALDNDVSFESGLRDLMKEVLPGEENEFQLLAEDHPLWNAEKNIPAEELRPILGIDFGCRTSILLIPAWKKNTEEPISVNNVQPSLSCLWETASERTNIRETIPETIQKKIGAALDLGVNILAYATNKEMKNKEEIPKSISAEENKRENKQGAIYASLLEFGGGTSCAPRAIPNLMKAIRNDLELPVQTFVRRLHADSDLLFDAPLLMMHGRNSFHFSDKERKNLILFFNRGGFLFANAICSSTKFEQSFIDEMARIVPDGKLEPIPSDDPLYSSLYGGFDIKEIEIKKKNSGEDRKTQTMITKGPPELQGIKREGRWIVIYSPHDVSCALEGGGALQCNGYTQKSAFMISVNVVLYSIEHL